jgi:hypothetical protein
MAVLAEAISVVVRRDCIERKLAGGWSAFVESVPNGTLCEDGEIARVGFMDPEDVGTYIEWLERQGLAFVHDGKALDLAVVDQHAGLTAPCEWLEFGRFPFDEEGGEIAVCWFFDEPRSFGPGLYFHGELSDMEISMPQGWTFEDSLSRESGFVATEEIDNRLRFLRHDDDGFDVYLDLVRGTEVYMGRPRRGPKR